MQYFSEALVMRETGIFQCLIETRDRTPVHLLVRPAAVNLDYVGLITVLIGVVRWPTKRLHPVCR